MPKISKSANFEGTILPHLDAAYNLARWLTLDGADADDVVQDAYLRAFRFFDGFHGGDSRAWIFEDSDSGSKMSVRQGYNLIHWSKAGMTFWAVSDLNLSELQEFAQGIQN